MSDHVIIDSGHTTILDNGGRGGISKVEPGCAICGANVLFCEKYPKCSGKDHFHSIARHDQKTKNRRRNKNK